jgi:hypothetical protein
MIGNGPCWRLAEMAHAGGVTRADEPVLITTAPPSPAEERRARERRYLITMGLRLICFILAIVLFGVGLRWVAAFAVAGSLILPWIAVVAANAGPTRGVGTEPSLYQARKAAELESGKQPDDEPR